MIDELVDWKRNEEPDFNRTVWVFQNGAVNTPGLNLFYIISFTNQEAGNQITVLFFILYHTFQLRQHLPTKPFVLSLPDVVTRVRCVAF
jgi:hypothetical protein